MEKRSLMMKIAYRRLYPVQIMSAVVSAANALIDSVVTARFLGTDAMAAIAFFFPVTTMISMLGIMISGIQILCSRFIGYGQSDRVRSLFTTGVLFHTILGMTTTALLIGFRGNISYFLVKDEHLVLLLSDYILGYSFGVAGQLLCQMLMSLLPLNNRPHLSYASIISMIFVNTALDILFSIYYPLGCFGMGLATAVSFIVAALILISGFFDRDRALFLDMHLISFKDIREAARLGLPILFFTLGISIRSYVLNNTLYSSIGVNAVAVFNFQSSLSSLIGAIPFGCASAFMILGSIYYGEEDRESLISCMKHTIKTGMILNACMIALLMSGAPMISAMLFSPAEETYDISIRMLCIFPLFLIFNLLLSTLIKGYNIEGKINLVNVIAFAEQVIVAFFAIVFSNIMGINGVWLSFSVSEFVCILIIGGYVFIKTGAFPVRAENWLMLDDDFGAGPDDYIEMTAQSMDDVIGMSERVIAFCQRKGMDGKSSYYAGISIEEMAGNIVTHGFIPGRKQSIEVKVVKNADLTIRIQDNCRLFDPKKRLDQFCPEDMTQNIGIRMISTIAKDMNYQNNVGINTLFITL